MAYLRVFLFPGPSTERLIFCSSPRGCICSTIMEVLGTQKPYLVWFWGAYFYNSTTNGPSGSVPLGSPVRAPFFQLAILEGNHNQKKGKGYHEAEFTLKP